MLGHIFVRRKGALGPVKLLVRKHFFYKGWGGGKKRGKGGSKQ